MPMPPPHRQFLLVHGGWQGGWCWDGVVAELREAGCEAFAPTLRGSDGSASDEVVDLSAIVADLVLEAERIGSDDLVVVGHSGGGPVIQALAERLPEQIGTLIFANAWVLEDGECVFDLFPPEATAQMKALAAESPSRSIPIDADFWCDVLLSDVPRDEAERWLPRLVSAPEGWLSERVRLPAFPDPGIAMRYLLLEDDRTMPREAIEGQAQRLPGVRIESMPGSHQAMLTRPQEFGRALLSLATPSDG